MKNRKLLYCSISNKAKIIGAGKPNKILAKLITNVFLSVRVKYIPFTNSLKYFRPTHGLSINPCPML